MTQPTIYFTIDADLTISAFDRQPAPTDESTHVFADKNGLARALVNAQPGAVTEIWNSFAGAVPFDDLKPVKKFTDRNTGIKRIWDAIQRLANPDQKLKEPAGAETDEIPTPAEGAPAADESGEATDNSESTTEETDMAATAAAKKTKKSKKPGSARATKAAAKPKPAKQPAKAKAEPTPDGKQHREGTKREMVLAMLARKNGTTVQEVMESAGWLSHTTRAVICTLGKSYSITSEKVEGRGRVYRLAA